MAYFYCPYSSHDRSWYAYLIRLERPLGNSRHQARYYLGIAKNWALRFVQHCECRGAKMLAFAVRQGISLSVVRVWRFQTHEEAQAFEQWAKKSCKRHTRLLSEHDGFFNDSLTFAV